MQNLQQETQSWYQEYNKKKGPDRNDLLTNAGVLYQKLAYDDAVFTALRKTTLDINTSKILDVGCGSGGGGARRALQLGFKPQNLYGIDILSERINKAKEKYPNINFVCEDAAIMPYDSNMFDLTQESTMFIQIIDEILAQSIASQMLRVTRPLGWILLIDWRYSNPRDSNYLGLSKSRIKNLFFVGSKSRLVCQAKGALVPPVGRIISRYFSPFYFIIRAVFPFLVGLNATLLQKIDKE